MKQIVSMAAIIAAITLATEKSGEAAPTVINFDDGTNGASVGSFYSGLGVTFSNTSFSGFGSLAGGSAPIAIVSTAGGTVVSPANPIVAVFSVAQAIVSITGLDIGAAGVEIRAFDAAVGGNLVDSDQIFGTGLGVDNFGTLSVTGPSIFRVEIFQPAANGADGVAFDNLSFDAAAVSAVPEPGTLALLGIGSLGMSLGAWRRKRSAARLA